jgi:uncharacterized membrane protein YfhO
MRLLGEINTKTEMVADKAFASQLPTKLVVDSTARIILTKYEPNHLRYTFSSLTDQMAVFSEIYYEKGWKALINGQEVPYLRANYVLRAMPLKAGNYEVEFVFAPSSYTIGNSIALLSSIILILTIIAYFIYQNKKAKEQKA